MSHPVEDETKKGKKGIAHRLYTGDLSYDFVANRKRWFAFLGALVLASLLLLGFKGLNLGIEFKGGTDFQAPAQMQTTTVDDIRSATTEFRTTDLDAQVFAIGDDAVRIQTRSLTPQEITTTREDIAELVSSTPEDVTYNTIGGSWGDKISKDAAVAVGVFIVLVMALIAIYFRDWRMSVAAIVALAHDMIITLGVYSLVGFTMTPSTLIGILTILGYSLYDTVVVFDKVKENTRGLLDTDKTYAHQANLAINQVLVRSMNTTIIGILPVLAMFIAGIVGQSDPLKDMGLALLVGMIAGVFSSIVIATPLLVWFKERTPEMREHVAEIEKRRERAEYRARGRHNESEANEASDAIAAEGPASAVASLPRQQRRTRTTRAERKKNKK